MQKNVDCIGRRERKTKLARLLMNKKHEAAYKNYRYRLTPEAKAAAASAASTPIQPLTSTPTSFPTSPKLSYKDERSKSAKRKALSRARCALPKEREKRATTLFNMVLSASPKTKQFLKQKGIYIEDHNSIEKEKGMSVLKTVRALKGKNNKESKASRKMILSIRPRA